MPYTRKHFIDYYEPDLLWDLAVSLCRVVDEAAA
jgi:hypothetical protein